MRKAAVFLGLQVPLLLLCGTFPLHGQEVHFGTGSWDPQSLGNHRAVLSVAKRADAVRAHIPWRRRDDRPEQKNLVVIEERTGRRVGNVFPAEVTRHAGDLVFQAQNPGTYFVYYLPYVSEGRNYPKVTYPPPEQTADPAWVSRHDLKPGKGGLLAISGLPRARLVEIQSVDAFSSFYPMEVTATAEEVGRLLRRHPGKEYLLFPEDRLRPIRMTADLPLAWIERGPQSEFRGEARKGEFYSFQIGVYAPNKDLGDVRVQSEDLRCPEANSGIRASAFRCINTGGVGWDGEVFYRNLSVRKGTVQALWIGIQVPADAPAGTYRGAVSIVPRGLPAQKIELALAVTSASISDSGDDESWRHSRLRWLDSRLAFDDEVVRPFQPVTRELRTIGVLGRSLRVGDSGLPEQIESRFSAEATRILDRGVPLLTAPLRLVVEDAGGNPMDWVASAPRFTRESAGAVDWEGVATSGPLDAQVEARMEFDGFVRYRVTLSASRPVEINDIRLEIPLSRERAKYMMGLGQKGGYRPASYQWKWEAQKNQDGAWLGDPQGGLQFSLRAENYSRPLNTNFYQSKPLKMPPSWFNDGQGGISIAAAGPSTVLVRCYSGTRTLQPGNQLHFDFNLLLTPFKPVDTKSHWNTRYFHGFKPVEEVVRSGANVINVHHANDANPYINYPFLHQQQMKSYIDQAHQRGLRVKIYYTIRELSNHAPELFALRSLGNEIFSDGPGGGYSWLQEHLASDYIAAWFVPEWRDAAVINSGMSRWHNYYVEGLDWLVRKMQIDGLYIDDIAFDRTTMKRVRKVLDRGRPDALIDVHSANQFNPRDGFANSANLYLEHFPYVNRLWFGEYFDPDSPPDFWLVEMSGIPYGLMGEMLQGGGNKWRGMIYGMTNRMPYEGNDPSPIWKVWDDFGIQESEMIGYWSPRCPVRTDHPDVPATAYVRHGKTLISLASWSKEEVRVRLSIDWNALGLDPKRTVLTAPEVRDFQPSAAFSPQDPVPVPAGKGWLLVVSEK